jgi:hypothetical protein
VSSTSSEATASSICAVLLAPTSGAATTGFFRSHASLAVYQHDARRLVDSVPAVLARHEPADAFRVWFRTLADYVKVKHGLGEALHTAAAKDAINATYAPVVSAVAALLEACAADGSMRHGLDPDDVLLLMGFMWRVADSAAGRRQADRMMELVIEGLRPRSR